MVQPIVFYDIPLDSAAPIKAWSPNTWKVRYTLNYKGIPYKTEWVEYPDIEDLCKKLGANPTMKKPLDGRDHYTLPMIYDPNTSQVIVDSVPISRYLDATYPSTTTPPLFPAELDVWQSAFLDNFWATFGTPVFKIVVAGIATSLSPRSAEYFRQTREANYRSKLEDLNTEEQWKLFEAQTGLVKKWFGQNGAGKDLSFTGESLTFSDVQIASAVVWARIILGEESVDWKRIAAFHDGFWSRFMAQFSKYEAVDA